MKKILLVLFISLFLVSCEISPPSSWYKNNRISNSKEVTNNWNISDIELPNEFYIDQNFSLFTKLSLVDKNNNSLWYSLTKETFSLWINVNMFNNDKKIYSAHKKIISIGNEIEIYDSNDNLIWTIEEEVIQSLFKTWTTYTIFDKDRNILWKSKKNDFLSTSFEIYDNNDKLIATMKRPTFRILDTWWIKIEDWTNINKALFLFIPVYKTISDQETKE